LYKEAIAIDRESLPPLHPDLATHLNNLAGLYAFTDRPLLAFKLMRQASRIEDRVIRNIFASSSDRDRLAYLKTIRGDFEIFLSLVYSHFPHSRAAKKAALNLTLKRKGLTASALAAFNQAIYRDRYPHLREKFQQWRQKCDELLELSHSQPEPEEKDIYQAALKKLEADCNQLERELAREVPEIQLEEQIGDRQAVALELPTGSTLIEFVRFKVFNFKAVEAEGESQWKPARYIAFILPAGQPSQVEMIDLGEAEPIDRLIQIYRDSVRTRHCRVLSQVGTRQCRVPTNFPNLDIGDVEEEPETETITINEVEDFTKGIELRKAIFDPIRAAIASSRDLIIAPDGNLNSLPFNILPNGEGETRLMDDFGISYLTVGRDILRDKIEVNQQPEKPLIIADPQFDLATSHPSHPAGVKTPASELKSSEEDSKKEQSVSTDFRDETGNFCPGKLFSKLSDTSFPPAKSTGYLAQAVAESLGVKPYLQKDAITTHLTNAKSPKILLVATHGFWLKQHLATQLKEEITQNRPDNPPVNSQYSSINRKELSTQVENPMMRSGLAFAGAKNWKSGEKLPENAGKGIVFAQDITGIDLWGTELALLIACQSGLGDVEAGEGVFGLRRAFFIAGAKTLIMSLWSVPERASILLMNRLFENLKKGLGRGEALQEAQTYIRTITIRKLQQSELGVDVLNELFPNNILSPEVIESQGDLQPLKHPYYWGAWVCQGDITNFPL
jgi:CHAT domain-containing protein